MQKQCFINFFLPAAQQAGNRFNLNASVILAQAAIESGWGESFLAQKCHNYFGITAYGKPNEFWNGYKTDPAAEGGPSHLLFRIYESHLHSFMDFARLIRSAYPIAADLSFHPEAYAKEIAYSRYISEVNGDNREAYRQLLVQIEQHITINIQKNHSL